MKEQAIQNINNFYAKDDKGKKRAVQYRKRLIQQHELLSHMDKVVQKYVQSYDNDFYIHDVEAIRHEDKSRFIWFVRDTGTELVNLLSERYDDDHQWSVRHKITAILTVLNNRHRAIFYYDGQKLKPIQEADVQEIVNRYEDKLKEGAS